MADHPSLSSDPIDPLRHGLHVPGFLGTNAQRLAYDTASLLQSDQWFETDTLLTYQWDGEAWNTLGSTSVPVFLTDPNFHVSGGSVAYDDCKIYFNGVVYDLESSTNSVTSAEKILVATFDSEEQTVTLAFHALPYSLSANQAIMGGSEDDTVVVIPALNVLEFTPP